MSAPRPDASMPAPLLAVAGLVVRYGPVTALAGVDLHVGEGETVAVIGPNGAGKSTLLGTVAGLVRAAGGDVAFRGETILGQKLERTVRRGIALVPEGRHVFAGLTVEENLKLGTTVRADRAAARADLEGFLETFPILGERRAQPAGRLSGGEQQMLVIARALLCRPALLMVDEPSLGLAPKIIDQVYEIFHAIRAQGTAVLLVEQSAARAQKIADRILVLNGGTIRLQGSADELAHHPGFEAAYFGLSPERAA